MRPLRKLRWIAAPAVALALAGCGGSALGTGSGGLHIVAAENFWGSIASQLAGTRASVQSIITNPAADPHSYQPTAADARAAATAKLVIVNGVGYDRWASQLLAASPSPGRVTLNIGDMFGLKEGDNPHRWYDPAEVEAVANRLTSTLRRLDPGNAAYYAAQRKAFEGRLSGYHAEIVLIRHRYQGTPVGASESIFALLAPSLGLPLITPPGFMKAITEGTDVSAQSTLVTQRQVASGQIKVWIYNSQNATPQVQRLTAMAQSRGIPATRITETLTPAGATFEQWQTAQLEQLAAALHRATGR
jgi:zinc/manganese transport system substrate-binding protein